MYNVRKCHLLLQKWEEVLLIQIVTYCIVQSMKLHLEVINVLCSFSPVTISSSGLEKILRYMAPQVFQIIDFVLLVVILILGNHDYLKFEFS